MKYPPEFTLNCKFWGDFYQRLELKGDSKFDIPKIENHLLPPGSPHTLLTRKQTCVILKQN